MHRCFIIFVVFAVLPFYYSLGQASKYSFDLDVELPVESEIRATGKQGLSLVSKERSNKSSSVFAHL